MEAQSRGDVLLRGDIILHVTNLRIDKNGDLSNKIDTIYKLKVALLAFHVLEPQTEGPDL